MTEQQEVWRIVPSLPEVMVSSLGRVMVVPYLASMPYGGTRFYGGEPNFGQWDGQRMLYPFRGKTYKVHRLVCEAFNGPPDPGQVVMHDDEDSRNNRPGNLIWGTQKQNLNYPGFLEHCRSRTGNDNPRIKGMIRKEKERWENTQVMSFT